MNHTEYQIVQRNGKFYVKSFHHGHTVSLYPSPCDSLEDAKQILKSEKEADLREYRKKQEEIVYREPAM